MFGEIFADFAASLAHLSYAESFAALGIAVFGLASVALTSILQNAPRAPEAASADLDRAA
jgi:hypothetical protein